ncbi:hypothetical protein IT570_11025 [Candidatus Sumerlaeota bacterium]|nr:hypothetical protein [Candidatus Sumerlaeota bacterium]
MNHRGGIWIITVVLQLLACGAIAAPPAKEMQRKVVGPRSVLLPYCEQKADAKDFHFSLEEKSVTVSLAKQDTVLKGKLSYAGKCMVWQQYSKNPPLLDRITAELPKDNDAVTSGPTLLLDATSAARTFTPSIPFQSRKVDVSGVVFCGSELNPLAVRNSFANTARPENFDCEGIASKEDCENYRVVYDQFYRDLAAQLQFVGGDLSVEIPLKEFAKFHDPGECGIRFGYFLYPETTQRAFYAPLQTRIAVWSEPITIRIVP